jgi:Uma2 family endonuclease
MSVMPATKMPIRKPRQRREIPPLENGDHLDQETFHERYEAMPEDVRAELIGGIVYMASPVGSDHSKEHIPLSTWAGLYEAATLGVEALSTPTVILADDCEPQPDVAIRLLKGKTKIVRRGKKSTKYIAGPPELVVEAAYTSESIDLNAKRQDYEKYGIGECVALLIRARRVVWFVRDDKKFVQLKPDADGILRSKILPGLWLDPAALLARNLARLIQVLNQGISSPEHAAFVAKLAKNLPSKPK